MKYHRTPIRVRFCEVDMYRVAWHGHYVAWCEVARVDVCNRYGLTGEVLQRCGCLVPVVRLSIEYKSPARNDDDLVVLIAPDPDEEPTKPLLTFHYRIERDGMLLASAETLQVLMSPEGKILYHAPDEVAAALARMREDLR